MLAKGRCNYDDQRTLRLLLTLNDSHTAVTRRRTETYLLRGADIQRNRWNMQDKHIMFEYFSLTCYEWVIYIRCKMNYNLTMTTIALVLHRLSRITIFTLNIDHLLSDAEHPANQTTRPPNHVHKKHSLTKVSCFRHTFFSCETHRYILCTSQSTYILCIHVGLGAN